MEAPAWITVESSVLAAIAYDAGRLWIRFRSGAIFRYQGVPQELCRLLLNAESKGRFFNLNIRDRFPSQRHPSSVATRKTK